MYCNSVHEILSKMVHPSGGTLVFGCAKTQVVVTRIILQVRGLKSGREFTLWLGISISDNSSTFTSRLILNESPLLLIPTLIPCSRAVSSLK